jgi:predicted TIM-barrel fold metal-dependent hydrolase
MSVDRPANLVVIDADTHFSEPADLWTKRAPTYLRDRVPQVRKDDNGVPFWYVDGDEKFGRAGGASVINPSGQKVSFWETDIQNGIGIDEIHPASYDVKARLEIMDDQGVWAQIVYPNAIGFAAGRLARFEDKELALAIIQIYNDALAEWQAESGERCLPQAMLPFWDVDQTVAELQRIKNELHMTGITMSGEPFNAPGLPDLADPFWDPMYEVCTDLSIPINIHIGSGAAGGSVGTSSRVWPSQDRYRSYVLNCVQSELSNSNFLTNLVISDLLVRWPELKFVSVESGIGWIPYVLERADYQLGEPTPEGVDLLARPSAMEIFHRNVYACFWFEHSAAQHLIEDVGVDNVMFESDFPHPTCLYPNPVERVLEQLAIGGYSEETIRKVMGGNAINLYKIKVPTAA